MKNTPNITELSLTGINLSQLSIQQLVSMYPNLTELNLQSCIVDFDLRTNDEIFEIIINSLVNLKEFGFYSIHDQSLNKIAEKLPNLKYITFFGEITDNGISKLFQTCKILRDCSLIME